MRFEINRDRDRLSLAAIERIVNAEASGAPRPPEITPLVVNDPAGTKRVPDACRRHFVHLAEPAGIRCSAACSIFRLNLLPR
jgi:hypothetical protein